MTGFLSRVVRRADLTAGQVWTLGLGLLLALVLLTTSLPPVLAERTSAAGSSRSAAPVAPPVVGGLSGPLLAPAGPALPGAVPPGGSSAGAPVLPTTPAGAEPSPEEEPRPGPPEAADPPPPFALPPEPQSNAPLTVRESGFSTTEPAASAASAGVPADGLPISVRLGAERERSYVRLSGAGTDLVLRISTAPGATVNPGQAVVRACPITTPTWQAARPGPPVPFDELNCVQGFLRRDDTVLFSLAGFPDRAGPAGFALVVDKDAPEPPTPRTFRLVLTPVPPAKTEQPA